MNGKYRKHISAYLSMALIMLLPALAHGQNISAASGQTFGTSITPSGASLPSNATGGVIIVPGGNGKPGSTITAGDLTPNKKTNSNLSSLANSNAGISAAANTSTTNAQGDQTQWGSAYRTLKGAALLNPHTDITDDPIWAQSDAVFTSVFANSFSGCTQTLGSPSVIVPPTKHSYSCIQTPNINMQCTITHTLGTNVIPAAQRCNPATFVTQNLTVYDNTPATPTQVVTDNISCDANGMLQHNLHSTLVTPVPSTCIKTAAFNSTCSVTHSYSAKTTAGTPAVYGASCNPGFFLLNFPDPAILSCINTSGYDPIFALVNGYLQVQTPISVITQPAGPDKVIVTDNGWSDTIAGSGCTAKANANPAGVAPLSFACANDPSGNGASWTSPGGIINKTDMTSPYTGISSLCKEMQVTENIPSVDGCAATKADPACKFVSSKILANGDTEFTYSCNKTTTATTVLSNCSNASCSVNL